MSRIYQELLPPELEMCNIVKEYRIAGKLHELKAAIPDLSGKFFRFNNLASFNTDIDYSNYRFIINFRDPRDRLCNLYYWAFVHPQPGVPEEKIAAGRARVLEQGIDSWVLGSARSEAQTTYHNNIWHTLNQLEPSEFKVLSYAKLCLDFDSFIADAARFIGSNITPTMMNKLEIERIENLDNNPDWVGKRWAGADVHPGRFKRELQPKTIQTLNEIFETQLDLMMKYDHEFSNTYSDYRNI